MTHGLEIVQRLGDLTDELLGAKIAADPEARDAILTLIYLGYSGHDVGMAMRVLQVTR